MKDFTRGEVLFSFVCLQLLSSVVSLNWTLQPSNPTLAVKGRTVSLTWRYSLTANEQTSSQSFFAVKWFKFNYSSSVYDEIGSKTFLSAFNPPLSYREPLSPHVVVDKKNELNSATLHINGVQRDDEGRYKIGYVSDVSGAVVADQEVNVTVLVPPVHDYMSNDADVCEGSLVRLSCNATGVPQPSIVWTQVLDKDTDSASLPAIDGAYVILDVNRSSSGTIYRCTAENGAGAVNRTVQVTVKYSPFVDEVRNSSNTVTEGDSFSMTCGAFGGPENYTWIRIDNGTELQIGNEAVLIFNNISRNDTGQYRCEAKNQCGNVSRVQSVDVYYPPTINTYIPSTLEENDTEEVSLTCEADSNPPAQITWIRLSNNAVVPMPFNISGKQDEGSYKCTASNSVGSTDSRHVFISVLNYRPFRTSLVAAKNPVDLNETFSLNCSADAQPAAKYRLYREQESLINTTVGNNFVAHLTTANKRKRQMNFRCTPFNEYGDGPTEIITVTVHFNPVNVTLVVNTTENKDCSKSLWVNFTCVTSEANPPVENYRLHAYRIGSNPNDSKIGTWNEKISSEGEHVYICLVQHKLGTVNSSKVTVIFNVPLNISVNVSGSTTLNENDSLFLNCYASGFPRPTGFTWTKRDDIAFNAANSWLNFTGITLEEAGGYICHANNTCGEDNSSVISVDVQYEPKNVTLSHNLSSTEVCAEKVVNLTCTAESANPPVHTFTLYENRSEVRNTGTPGIWTMPLNIGGQVIYKCEANNSIRPVESNDVTFSVEVGASVTIENKTTVVDEGEDVILVCKVFGFPSPDVFWVNNTNGRLVSGNTWRLPNISRNDAGEYNCSASNACGNVSEKAVIDVRYPPFVTKNSPTIKTAFGGSTTLSCPIGGNPDPNITWHEGNDTSGKERFNGKNWTFKAKSSDTGWYVCFAKNVLGTASAGFRLTVVVEEESTSPTQPGGSDCEESFFKDTSCAIKLKVAIGISVAAVVVIVIVTVIVGYWIHKKRKCRKDTRIAHDPGCEEQRLQGDDRYGQVNNGYAETGPPSANSTEKAAAAVPDYAVVDKSAKKKKKNEKVDDSYAKVDMSKKTSKKKPRPGEDVLYADLGDFNGTSQMPAVATSPKALPPIKKPDPYEGTQYADITQFLKDDATLPKYEKQDDKQGTEIKEKDEKTDGAGGENAPKETPM